MTRLSLASVARATALAAVATLVLPSLVLAAETQVPPTSPAPTAPTTMGRTFQTKELYAGPRIGVGNLEGGTAFGAQVERGITEPGKAGPGIISGGIGVDFYSWSEEFPYGSYDVSVVPIQLFSNYHYPIKNSPKLDPYAGLSLVWSFISASAESFGVTADASDTEFDFAGQAGMRYFVSDKFSVHGQLGFGYTTLGFGASWMF